MATHLLNAYGATVNENKLYTQRPTPFYDAGTVPVRLASVPFDSRNAPIRVAIDEPPKRRLKPSVTRGARRGRVRRTRGKKI